MISCEKVQVFTEANPTDNARVSFCSSFETMKDAVWKWLFMRGGL
jgi:hypothetical protein